MLQIFTETRFWWV